MVQRFNRCLSLMLLLVIASCAQLPQTSTEVDDLNRVPKGDVLNQSPALGLWQQAEQALAENNLLAASRLLERAMAIEPGSSWLHYQTAKLRLRQGDAKAAEGFARKALRQAVDDRAYIQSVNQLINVSVESQDIGIVF